MVEAAGAGAPSSISRPLLTDFARTFRLMFDDTTHEGNFHTTASSAIEVYWHHTLKAFS